LFQVPGQLAGYQMATGRNMFGNLFGGSPGGGYTGDTGLGSRAGMVDTPF
jgi:hypothetical protein